MPDRALGQRGRADRSARSSRTARSSGTVLSPIVGASPRAAPSSRATAKGSRTIGPIGSPGPGRPPIVAGSRGFQQRESAGRQAASSPPRRARPGPTPSNRVDSAGSVPAALSERPGRRTLPAAGTRPLLVPGSSHARRRHTRAHWVGGGARRRRGAVLPERGRLPRRGPAQPCLVRHRGGRRRPARGVVQRQRRAGGRRRQDPGGLAQGGRRRVGAAVHDGRHVRLPRLQPGALRRPRPDDPPLLADDPRPPLGGGPPEVRRGPGRRRALRPPAMDEGGGPPRHPPGLRPGDGAGDRGDPRGRPEVGEGLSRPPGRPVPRRAVSAPRVDAPRPPGRCSPRADGYCRSIPTRSTPRSSRSRTTAGPRGRRAGR